MSRPRKPYGPNPPGRLMGTMIKVLAAELSDQGRLSRGKRYWADDAVIDIVVGHGAVTAEIQGSRRQPYVVTIEATAGSGVPARREVWAQCTCPDDTGTGVDLCKHAVAAMFTLADEVSIDPELIDRWRASRRRSFDHAGDGDPAGDDEVDDPHDDGDVPDAVIALADRRAPGDDDLRHGAASGPGADVVEFRSHAFEDRDAIAGLLRPPAGRAAPSFPEPGQLDHGPIRDRLLAETLADALDHLAIRWE